MSDLKMNDIVNTAVAAGSTQQSNSPSKDSYRQGENHDRTKEDADYDPKIRTASSDQAKTEKYGQSKNSSAEMDSEQNSELTCLNMKVTSKKENTDAMDSKV